MIKKILKYIFGTLGFQISRVSGSNKVSDKLIYTKVGNYNILINERHTLPGHLKQLPNYSSNLPRIASKVKEKYADLILIDIGANVGDSVALIRSKSYFPIVCIEGEDFYFSILQKNITQFKEVQAFQFFLGENNNIISGTTEMDYGTLKIIPDKSGNVKNNIPIITLDKFMEINPIYRSAKVLKIDTDGFDLMILRGGLDYIAKTSPVLFFEYSRTLLEGLGDDGLGTLNLLESMGYETAIFYDNFGRFILSTELKNKSIIEQLHYYISEEQKKSAVPFYDICLFHKMDKDLAQEFIKEEMTFFKTVDY